MNIEFLGDWKGSTCGLFKSAVAVYNGKLRENFMLVRSLPEIVKFVDCAQVHYGST
jgi:predicted secreted protein